MLRQFSGILGIAGGCVTNRNFGNLRKAEKDLNCREYSEESLGSNLESNRFNATPELKLVVVKFSTLIKFRIEFIHGRKKNGVDL